jgi:hypothetical protein
MVSATALASEDAAVLRNDLDYSAGRRIDQHRRVVDDGIIVCSDAVLGRNWIDGHPLLWENVANDDLRMVGPGVRRDVLLDDVVMEPRRSRRSGRRRSPPRHRVVP